MAQALVDAGWKVTVVTIKKDLLVNMDKESPDSNMADDGGLTVIGTGHSWRCLVPGIVYLDTKKGLSWAMGGICRRVVRALWFGLEIGWRKQALAAASAFKQGDVDVVLSSGPPWVSHEVAAEIASKLRCPYVLDYRDLWTGNPHFAVRCRWVTSRERTLYHGATAVITVSPAMHIVQEKLFGHHATATVVSNGYSLKERQGIIASSFQDFSLVYAGIFLPPVRTIDPLFLAFRQLLDDPPSNPWSFHYYGGDSAYVQESVARHGLKARVHIHDQCSRREALSAVKGAGMALVVASVAGTADTAEAGILTGKIFDIIGLQVPFLIVAPLNADIRRVVVTTGGGCVFAANEVEAMAQYIRRVIAGERIAYREPQEYSWERLGHRLTEILESVIGQPASHA